MALKTIRPKKQNVAMDMTPMIDCVFQLLVFFMLSSSFLTPAIKLALPEAKPMDDTEPLELAVTVSAAGEVFVNSDRCTLDTLESTLRPYVEKSKHKIVTFKGDKAMQFEIFVKALEAAKHAGAVSFDVSHSPPN